MNIQKRKQKRIYACLAVGLCAALVIGMVRFERRCEALRDNCLRLHILANSDCEFDQNLKLKIRDEILEISQDVFENVHTREQAIAAARDNQALIVSTAKKVCEQNGVDYTVNCEIAKQYFTTREYENFTLPAGNYEAVRLLIGEAEGKNWWCVMFPSVCIGSCAESELEQAAGSDAAKIALSGSKYKMKFKIVEIFQNIKHKVFDKKQNIKHNI